MSHRYFPHTEEDKRVMLEKCGVDSIDELFADIPAQLRLSRPYALGKPMSEVEVRAFSALSPIVAATLHALPATDTTTATPPL